MRFSRCAPLLLLLPLPLVLVPVSALAIQPPTRDFQLRLFHTHTGERIDIVYRHGDTYVPEALDKLDHFLRDHRTGDVRHYDPRLFDLLWDLEAAVGRPLAELHIVCGYRTPWSNEFLRTHSSGVAQHSLHMQAEAIDIRLPGTNTSAFRNAALALHRGGVGYYAHSDFIHVDLGRVRKW
jgi:uncharacterized protein YcbK (DUF882 family)